MRGSLAKAVCRIVLLLAILCAPQVAQAQELSDKERSERINQKSYTDEEWDDAVRAFKSNQEACDNGSLQACIAAADAYSSGDGVWPALSLATVLYKEACEAGYAAGCRALGELLNGELRGMFDHTFGANEFFEKGCDLGDLASCKRFADGLRGENYAEPDLPRARAVLESTCEAGFLDACASLGQFLRESGDPEDDARGLEMLDAACRNSSAEACDILLFRFHGGPHADEVMRSRYLHFACYLGSFGDCRVMGDRAYAGLGVAKDRDLALSYYSKACQLGADFCDVPAALRALPQLRTDCAAYDAQACAALGKALALERSPEADRELAADLLRSSCRKGIADACLGAARLLHLIERDASPWDEAKMRIELLEQGCTLDDPLSCFMLARSLDDGLMEMRDLNRAVELYARLCDVGFLGDEELTPCQLEGRQYGYVPSARAAVADESFDPPSSYEEVIKLALECLTHKVRFRGKTYSIENCPWVEKGLGSYRLKPGQVPWQALIWRPKRLAGQTLDDANRVSCGGSLIATGWILTAAHCLDDAEGTKVASAGHRIRLGVFNPNRDEGISFPILRTIAHPDYDKSNRYVFDIALIQYDHRAGERGAETNTIRPILLDPLPVGVRKIERGMTVYAYGWGFTELKGRTTDYLQGMKMQLSTESACTSQTKFRNALRDAALCAGGSNGAQACYGDSGGPLVYYGDGRGRPTLIGVVSAGQKCGTTGNPSQYTRVARVRAWIDSYVGGVR